jgi:hypothetical protein
MAADGNHVLVTRGLSITGTGKLDLRDNDLVVDYAGDVSPIGAWSNSAYTGVTGLVQSGAIGTSSATPITRLGVDDASHALHISGSQTGLFDGQTVDATAVLVKYTYGGDAMLDGKVDVDDYGRIDFNIPLGTSGWANGDFNFDGQVNVDDYGLIDFAVATQASPL